ncbi:hypothetical protein CEQ83_05690 [Priestia megaterium]|uniref:glycosyltransferase family 4 protein n=1 Tax=Priestia megaterium TaxID=1404 RepID=UPI0012AA46FA|nr:glycosyltransferase family 4 protein [Priestia megaterium]QFY72024.1 hypothetical protein CEQ83_05690 [Priestia megaterium]
MLKSVVHISDYSSLYSGNFVKSLQVLSYNLKKSGFQTVLVFPYEAKSRKWAKELIHSGHKVYFLSQNTSTFKLIKEIKNIIVKENSVIVHSHFTNYDILTSLSASVASVKLRRKIKVIWHVHSDFPIKYNNTRILKDFLKFRIIGNCNSMITVSEELRKQQEKRGGRKELINYIPNGIDFSRIQRKHDNLKLRSFYGISQKDLVLLSFGWDPITKGIDTILDALEAIEQVKEKPPVKMIVIGEDTLNEFIKNRYNTNPPEWLIILPPNENVSEYYQIANIFISASRWEGFSYSVAEAMYSGLLIIANQIKGLNWIEEAPFSLFYSNSSSKHLKNLILDSSLNSNEKIDSISKSNKKFIEENYTMEIWSEKIISYYKSII